MIFKRKIYDKLLDWKNNYSFEKALLIEGARRIGKSTIVEEFAKNEFKSYLFIDFNDASDIVKDAFNHYLNDFGGLKNLWIGDYFGAIGETCTLLIFILGIILALLAVIDWYIPLTYLGTIFIGTFILALFKELGISYPLAMIANGGVAFAGFFMLTDPVTNPNTRQGKIVASIIAAFITMLIRYCAILPEGALYSILIVNILTPAIEKFFEGKNDLNEKRDLVVILVLFILVVTSIVLMGSGLKGHYNKETLAIIKEVIL